MPRGMPVGWVCSDAEQAERAGAGGIAPGPAHPLGDVGLPGQPQQADCQVAQGCHHLGAVPGADLGAVLVEGDVATQWRRFSISHWPRTSPPSRAGPARAGSRLVMP